MGGANTGASGSDAGFTNSVQTRNKKANDAAAKAGSSDYQGETYSGKGNKNNNNNNNGGGGGDGNNAITQVTKTAPTVSEVSQATTTEADADTEANRLLKIKKKGRSQSIISGSQGVTKTSTDYSLGKKSLLGQV